MIITLSIFTAYSFRVSHGYLLFVYEDEDYDEEGFLLDFRAPSLMLAGVPSKQDLSYRDISLES